MKPPEAPLDTTGNLTPAVSSCPTTISLKKMRDRSQFLAAARARKQVTRGFIVQARERGDGDSHMHMGFTASKKVGNAVARNRAKRRLRAVAREILPLHGQAGWDYVLIGRRDMTASVDYEEMRDALIQALQKLHALSP